MNYYVVITPDTLTKRVRRESKRVVKTLYNKSVDGVYYRVKTQERPSNPRRLFLRGNGEVKELDVKPHISLLHNIIVEKNSELERLKKRLKAITSNTAKFELKFKNVGNYNEDFTFFAEYESKSIEKLKNKVVEASREFLDPEYAKKHFKKSFVPHATILYDDISPSKVRKAQEMFEKKHFQESVSVKSVCLWEVTPEKQDKVAEFVLK